MEPRPRPAQLAHQPLTNRPIRRYAQRSAVNLARCGNFKPALRITQRWSYGSAVSPILANLFMHYAFDSWMAREFPGCPFERYADDGVPRMRKEESSRSEVRLMQCCTRDEGARLVGRVALRGRPAGGGRKPPRGAPVKSRGAERRGDGALSARQVWITKASESEPPLKCRKRIGDIRNRGRVVAPGGAWREPVDWPGGCPAWMVARA